MKWSYITHKCSVIFVTYNFPIRVTTTAISYGQYWRASLGIPREVITFSDWSNSNGIWTQHVTITITAIRIWTAITWRPYKYGSLTITTLTKKKMITQVWMYLQNVDTCTLYVITRFQGRKIIIASNGRQRCESTGWLHWTISKMLTIISQSWWLP